MAGLFLNVTTTDAQQFEFQYQGRSLSDGAIVTIPATKDSDGLFRCTTNPSNNPDDGLVLKLLNGSTASGYAHLDIVNNILETSNLAWGMGGESTFMKHEEDRDQDFNTTNGIVPVKFNAENIQNKGALDATLSATIGGETHTVKILFSSVSSSINELIWWGYFSESDIRDYYAGLGTGQAEASDAAIFIPGNHPITKGSTIRGIRIWLDYGIDSKSISNVKVWISKSLPESLSDAEYVQDYSIDLLQEGFNEILFDTPFPIQEQDLYVGYTIELNEYHAPTMIAGNWVENSFFFRSSVNNPKWRRSQNGKLGVQVLLDDVVLPSYSVSASDFGKHFVEKGKAVNIPIRIKNEGTSDVTSISYTITTNGNTSTEKTQPVYCLPFNNTTDIFIPFPADKEARNFAKTLNITKVNGMANATTKATAEGTLITILEKPIAVPVVEEFTGTWCGWCPIGIDGMEKAHEAFGDNAVLISVHNSDVMETYDYAPIINSVNNYPSSHVNRLYDIYPSAPNLKEIISQELTKVTLGTISVEARWNGVEQSAIEIETKTQFFYSDEDARFGIAYVLVEDGLSGSGPEWGQQNYLSGESGYGDLPFWYDAPSIISNLKYNHVAVAAWNIKEGIRVKDGISAGEDIENCFLADISVNQLIQNKSELSVVVLLIDQYTGSIINAAKTSISDFDPTAIRNVNIEKDTSDIYDLNGRKVCSSTGTLQGFSKGIYIQNGRKIVVK